MVVVDDVVGGMAKKVMMTYVMGNMDIAMEVLNVVFEEAALVEI